MMEKTFFDYLSEPANLVFEREWDRDKVLFYETIFTLGNGYLGIRGVLDENPTFSHPGTYFIGVYDGVGTHVPEIVNAPNPINFNIFYGGEKVSVENMDVISHRRILDIKKGILYRKTEFLSSFKKRIILSSLRFLSMKNPHLLVVVLEIQLPDSSGIIHIDSSIDTNAYNLGMLTEGKKIHYHILDFEKKDKINILLTKTLEREFVLAYGHTKKVVKGKGHYFTAKRQISIKLKRKEVLRIYNYFWLERFSSEFVNKTTYIKRSVFNRLKKEIHKNLDKLFDESFKIWQKKWEIADIKIRGDRDIERGLRFNIYHLINSAPRKEIDASIPARGVSGEGYRGHIFWDTEIFIFPFFVYLFPDIAKNLLLYRVKRLEKAKEIAKRNAYEGAMFPWESAFTGDETTPAWSKDFDGRIIRILTHKQEHHVTADIGYALILYFRMTQDFDFMLKYGLELLFEIARFWNSRLEYNRKRKFYEMRRVMGPDEFHPDVNNNAYTNFLAKYILKEAVKIYKFFSFKFGKKFKKVIKRIFLKKKEVMEWQKKMERIFIPYKKGIMESFEGYLKLKKYPLPHLNKNFLPDFPKIPLSKIHRTQFIKQPDVVMLFALFPHSFSYEEKRKNFLFYEERTLHKSSLSPSIHSLIAAQLGMETFAYRFLKLSVNVDLQDSYGNTGEGIHMANAGSSWQAFVRGIGGVIEKDGALLIQPHLPKHWEEISFKLFFKNSLIEIFIDHEKIRLKVLSSSLKTVDVIVYGKREKIGIKKEYVFSRRGEK